MELIKLFNANGQKSLEYEVNTFLCSLRPSIIVKDITYQRIDINHWTGMVLYDINTTPYEERGFYDGKPIFEAANEMELTGDIAKYKGEVTPPYVVRIPHDLKEIEKEAFKCDGNIGVILIQDGTYSIGECAFKYCENLASVKIADSVKSIEKYAFYKCNKLKEIYIKNPDLLSNVDLSDDVKIITT